MLLSCILNELKRSNKQQVTFQQVLSVLCLCFCCRQTAVGLIIIVSRTGSILAPSLTLLARYHFAIPTTVYGSLTFVSGALCFLLPETRRKELPDLISDAVDKDNRWSRLSLEFCTTKYFETDSTLKNIIYCDIM